MRQFRIKVFGIDNSQYFRGSPGFVGIGDTQKEAVEDAFEALAAAISPALTDMENKEIDKLIKEGKYDNQYTLNHYLQDLREMGIEVREDELVDLYFYAAAFVSTHIKDAK